MLLRRYLLFLLPLLVFWLPALAQTDPPPADPHELVTRQPKMLSKTGARSGALDLLARAHRNFDLRDLQVPFSLKVSFESRGSTLNEGSGTMEDVSDGQRWRWTAYLGQAHVVRIGADNRVYGDSEPVPLRIQMVRSILLRPVIQNASRFEIRASDVQFNGKTVSCFLLSHSLPPNPAPRAWVEREDCIDPETGLLQTWSEAPGVYAIYDYSGAEDFHGHLLPRQISVYEEGRLALTIRVESFKEAPGLDASLFTPTPEMIAAGEAFALDSAGRWGWLRVDPEDAPASRFFQVVVVHATIDAQDGSVLDAEALQDSNDDLGRVALDMVRNNAFDATGFQQELFVNVQFHLPAMRYGGPPIAVFRSHVRWISLEPRRHTIPVHAPTHVGK